MPPTTMHKHGPASVTALLGVDDDVELKKKYFLPFVQLQQGRPDEKLANDLR